MIATTALARHPVIDPIPIPSNDDRGMGLRPMRALKLKMQSPLLHPGFEAFFTEHSDDLVGIRAVMLDRNT
jgi:hypothetical protein